MFRIILFVAIFCLLTPVYSEIIKASDLKEITTYLQKLDTQSLLLWDVDETLIMPHDQVLQPKNEHIAKELHHHYLGQKSREERHWLFSQILNYTPYQLIDPTAPQLIASLQQKAIPMIAFTAMRTGTLGVIPSMENWRFQQLKNLGIDFSAMFPQYSGLTWHEDFLDEGSPVFKAGILCSDRLEKGPVLATFLQKINWNPTQVIFIDDCLEFLMSVEEALQDLDIPFIGIHYQAAYSFPSTINMEIAHLQYQILVDQGKWVTDQEASILLQEQQCEINIH